MSGHLQFAQILPTMRLILWKLRHRDATAIFSEYSQDPQVTYFMTWRLHKSLSETEEFLASCAERRETDTEYSWIISLKKEDHASGMITCRPSNHGVEIGYVLFRRPWNQGLMSEAFTAIVD
jgi:RimJ/RimL family protein N-acetyltransferase